MKILITGATGFVGRAVTKTACLAGHNVTALVREHSANLPAKVSQIAVGDFAKLTDEIAFRQQTNSQGSESVRCLNDEKNSVIASEAKQSEVDDGAATAFGLAVTKKSDGLAVTKKSVGLAVISDDLAVTSDDLAVKKNNDALEFRAEKSDVSVTSLADKFLSAMQGVEVVIHTAARAHVMHEAHEDPASIYQLVNVTLTERLAEAAAKAGIKRFVFISSIKVNGEQTESKPFTEADKPNPQDAYAMSKWQAEQKLIEIGRQTGMEIVILRPPMIYGPGVKGNFASLIKLVGRGIPLPFGAINNQRSLLALDNLVSAILLSVDHPAASNQTFLVADNELVSTTQLLRELAAAQSKKARLLPVSLSWMKFGACLIGKQSVTDRLFGSLVLDTHKIRDLLGWQPVISMAQQLKKMRSDWDDDFPDTQE